MHKPLGLICDIDGTLACADHRKHLIERPEPDWKAFCNPDLAALDTPIEGSQDAIENLMWHFDGAIIFLTGRNEVGCKQTREWLTKYYGIFDPFLVMRPTDNQEKPTDLKGKALDNLLLDFRLVMAFDDDLYMQSVYTSKGIVPFHAPECWKIIFQHNDLPQESYWRY